MADGKLIFDTGLDTSGIEKGISGLGNVLEKGMGAAVKGIAAVGTGLAAAGVAAFGFSTEFESALAKTSTMFGDVDVNMDNLEKQTLALSNSTGIAASTIGESLYNALSAGIPATEDMGDAMDFMGKNAKLAKAGFTDIDTAVTTTAKILNAYGMEVTETDKVHKILMQTQNNGITTVGELGAVLAGVTPTAAAMGVSFEAVGASLATLTAQGTPTAQAVTQLNALLAELGKSGTTASDALKEKTGKSFQELTAEGMPLNEVLAILDSTAQANGESMLDMFGSIEAGKAALSITSEEGASFTKNLEAMGTTADVVGSAYDKVAATTEENINRMKENVKNLGISVMSDNSSLISELTSFSADIVAQLNEAYGEGGLGGLSGKIGDVLAQVVQKVIDYAPEMISGAVALIEGFVDGLSQNKDAIFDGAEQIIDQLISGIEQFSQNDSLISLASDILTFLAEGFIKYQGLIWDTGLSILTQLVQGIAAPENMEKIISTAKDTLQSIVDSIQKNLPLLIQAGLEIIVQLALAIAESLPELIPAIVDTVIMIVETLIDNIDMLVDAAIAIIVALADGLIAALPKLIEKAPEIVAKLVTAIITNVPKLLEAASEIIKKLVVGIVEKLPEIGKAAGQIIKTVVDGVMQLAKDIYDLGKNIVTGIWEGISGSIEWIKGKVKGFVDGIVGVFTGKDGFDTHSPSKVTEAIGENVGLGVGVGMDKSLKVVEKSAQGIATSTVGVFTKMLADIDASNEAMVLSTTKKGKQTLETQEQINKRQYEQAMEFVKLKKELGEISAAEEVQLYQYIADKYQLTQKQMLDVQKDINKSRKEADKDFLSNAKETIDMLKTYGEMTVEQEIGFLEELQSQREKYSDDHVELEKMKQDRLKEVAKEYVDSLKEEYEKQRDLQMDALDREIDAVKDATDKKIAQYDREYDEKLKVIDREMYDAIKGLQGQIDALDNQTNAEERQLREREKQQRIYALQQKVANAKDAEERIEAQKALDDELAKQQREALLEQRNQQKESLKQQIDAIKENGKERKDELKRQHDEEVQRAKDLSTKRLDILNEEKKDTKTLYDNLIAETKKQFEQSYTLGLDFMKNLDQGLRDGMPEVGRSLTGIASELLSGIANNILSNMLFGGKLNFNDVTGGMLTPFASTQSKAATPVNYTYSPNVQISASSGTDIYALRNQLSYLEQQDMRSRGIAYAT